MLKGAEVLARFEFHLISLLSFADKTNKKTQIKATALESEGQTFKKLKLLNESANIFISVLSHGRRFLFD